MGVTTSQALSPASQALRDGGGAARAARAAANRESQANGALMRVSPLGDLRPRRDARGVGRLGAGGRRSDAPAPGLPGRQRGLRGGHRPRDLDRRRAGGGVRLRPPVGEADSGLHADVLQTLEAAAEKLPEDFSSQMGWVRIALQNAFYAVAAREDASRRRGADGAPRRRHRHQRRHRRGAARRVHGARAVPAQWRDRRADVPADPRICPASATRGPGRSGRWTRWCWPSDCWWRAVARRCAAGRTARLPC